MYDMWVYNYIPTLDYKVIVWYISYFIPQSILFFFFFFLVGFSNKFSMLTLDQFIFKKILFLVYKFYILRTIVNACLGIIETLQVSHVKILFE